MSASTPFDRRTTAKIGVGFVVAAALVFLGGWVVGWNRILATLVRADYRWLVLACLSSTVCLAVWAKAWDDVLALLDVHISHQALVVTYLAATFADYVTPFGKVGGNPFIAYVLSQDDRLSYQESLAGIVTADLLNLVPFFVFAGAGLGFLLVVGDVPAAARPLIGSLAAVAVLAPAAVYLSYRCRDRVESLLTWALSPIATRTDRVSVASVRERLEEFYQRIDRISGHPRVLAATLGYSFLGWAFFAFPLYLAGRAVGVHLDPLLVVFLVPASSLAGVTPTPGGVGGVAVVLTALLVVLASLEPHTAAAVALLYRIASYWYVVALGGVAAFYEIYRA